MKGIFNGKRWAGGYRSYLLGGALVLIAAVALAGVTEDGSETGSPGSWQQIELTDVNSGDTFTVAELDKPVLVESFAVWCPTCTRQQQEIKKLHESSDVTSVSLDVDPNEQPSKITQHTRENGFDWRYAVSPPEMTRKLVDRYDSSVANPPSAPVILVCENSTRKLPNGVKPVSKLKQEIESGC